MIYLFSVKSHSIIYQQLQTYNYEKVSFYFNFLFFSLGDIRCHCNQPSCVRTGYMCKSNGPQAGCFVEHSGYMDRSSDISRHGCIDMLPIEVRVSCLERAVANSMRTRNVHHRHLAHRVGHNQPGPVRTHNKSITCCIDDMCNYVKTISDDNNESHRDKHKEYRHHIITDGDDDNVDDEGHLLSRSNDLNSIGIFINIFEGFFY